MTDETEWYLKMAKAIQARDHAKKMILRWEAKVTDEEQNIKALAQQRDTQEAVAVAE